MCKIIKTHILVALIILINSCANEKERLISKDLEIISFIDRRKEVNIDYSTFFSDTTYIKLETNDDVLISGIDDIRIDSGYFFIKSELSIYIFDLNGKFINKAGEQGQGPKEYFYISAFYIDKKHKFVCIFDHTKNKIFRYDYNGTFQDVIPVENSFANARYMEMSSNEDLVICYPMKNSKLNSKYEYQFASMQDNTYKITEKFSPHIFTADGISALFSRIPLSINDTSSLLITSSSNNIYAYENNTITEKYSVELPGKKIDSEYINKTGVSDYYEIMKMNQSSNMSFGVTGIINTPDFIFISVDNFSTGIWDKKEKKGVLLNFMYDKQLNNYFSLIGSAFTLSNSDKLIGILELENLFFFKEEILSGNSKLKKLLPDSKEDDNPIICIYDIHPDCVNRMIDWN